MAKEPHETSQRKKDHLNLCLKEEVGFKNKTNGFDKYEFVHNAATEIKFKEIELNTKFFGYKINYPILISCMTGGTIEAESINAQLAEAANEIGIPIGVGSQRQALENNEQHDSYKIIRKNAPDVPVLGNIGAAQVAVMKDISEIQILIDLIEANAMVIHLNPLQELIQKKGEPDFSGFLKNLEKICKKIKAPVIVKEVGAGINKSSARKLLEAGARGIDVAGAGGTSWSGVEYLRNKDSITEFWDWGLPTTYCIKDVKKLKKSYYFTLIASGGINSGEEIAKSIALGADLTASARPLLKAVSSGGIIEVKKTIEAWFDTVKKIMYLTGANNIEELKKVKLLRKEELY